MARRSKKRTYAKAHRRQGVMNGTEQWYYSTHLEPKLSTGDYSKVEFERVKVVLVHPDSVTKRRESTYLCDFYCVAKDGTIEMHETKGFCDEADRLKIKFAAEMFPEWRWFLIQISGKKIKKLEEF